MDILKLANLYYKLSYGRFVKSAESSKNYQATLNLLTKYFSTSEMLEDLREAVAKVYADAEFGLNTDEQSAYTDVAQKLDALFVEFIAKVLEVESTVNNHQHQAGGLKLNQQFYPLI
jgi:hypothetical protein